MELESIKKIEHLLKRIETETWSEIDGWPIWSIKLQIELLTMKNDLLVINTEKELNEISSRNKSGTNS